MRSPHALIWRMAEGFVLQSCVMRILLLSDIHANLFALETALHAAPTHDGVWCMGDVVGYGPHPNECIARLRELDALTLTGNHDQAALGNVPLEHFRDTARRALEWTQQVLTAESLAWLKMRPPMQRLAQYGVTLVHASPRSPIWEYIDGPRVALENFAYFDTPICFFGHTHQPILYRLRAGDRVFSTRELANGQSYVLEHMTLLNPGSVGQPRDGDPRAAFGIYDTVTHTFVMYRIAYEIAKTQRAMQQVNLPARLIARLEIGE
jgi:diadenosine tetraphosphatase ApaH/serine/threonine PP2A family protein phosphatase